MRILFLSSIYPRFVHEKAASFVFATLLEEIATLGHEVKWATILPWNVIDQVAEKRLSEKGILFLGDFSDELKIIARPKNKYFRFLHELWLAYSTNSAPNEPRFQNPHILAKRLIKNGCDVAVTFWDTWFDLLIPSLEEVKLPVVGYWARPRYASAQARLREKKCTGVVEKGKKWIHQKLLAMQERVHLSRARETSKISNICELDAFYYRDAGLSCKYISNTWPDNFKDVWEKNRALNEPKTEINILANIGNLGATGNSFGLEFLRKEVLPILERKYANIPWRINICGSGELRDGNEELTSHKRVYVKGFVDDLDKEMLASDAFLLLNNAGPYTGGYTRVIYAFSSGICLIAHKKLADSMPELKHNINSLLGNTGEEIADLIAKVCADQPLRLSLGREARSTYENIYHPHRVATQLVGLCEEAINS